MHWATADNGVVLDGVPRTAGRFPIAVTVTDAAGQRSAQAYVLDITSTDTGDSVNVPVTESVSVTDLPSVGSVIQVGIAEPISVTDLPSLALPVLVNVAESISITDTIGTTESVFVAITEPITVTDTPLVSPPLQVSVSEAISVSDMVGSTESVFVAISEPITVTDIPLVSPPLQVSISEAISVTDTVGTAESVFLAISEPITVTDMPLVSPPLQLNVSEAISVSDMVGSTESVLVAISEPISVTDVPSAALPLQVNVSEAISVTDRVGTTESVFVAISEPITVTDAPAVVPAIPATPVVAWAQPTAISYGTALSAAQLDATASVPGIFTYSPTGGTVLHAGSQTLSVTFTPNDSTNYNSVTTTVPLTVNKVNPVITWANPAPIAYGTKLSDTQLNATANLTGGTFLYTPAAGGTPTAGSCTLSVLYTPADTVDYNTASASVTLQVTLVTPVVIWNAPPSIVYGIATGIAQQTATANVPGSFFYTTPNGTVFGVGTHPMGVAFIPSDLTDYQPVSAYATITVTQATPVVTWNTPQSIVYGTALSSAQQTATANVPGSFFYTAPNGTVFGAGTHPLGAAFTPADTTDYKQVSAYTTITVTQATPVVTWATPAAITYGTPLSSAQLNATANIPGSFFYTSPAGLNPAGTLLPVGVSPLGAGFTPTDGNDYTPISVFVTIAVNKATTTTTIAVTTTQTVTGTTATITTTVKPQIGGTPTGMVTYYSGSTLLGSAAVGKAFTSGVLPVGTDQITAVYGGDSNFVGSASSATAITGRR
jgi:hypothetical protein